MSTPHGGDGRAVALQLGIDPSELLDLSASLNPVAPDPRPVVARHLDSLLTYPDDIARAVDLVDRIERTLAVALVAPAALLLTARAVRRAHR